MTKSQEQRMNEVFNNYINERNFYEESISDAFKYGYEAAMKEAEVLVEALEFYRNRKNYEYKEFSDGIQDRGDFPVMDDYGTKAFRALEKFKEE